jgi:predicted ATPase
MIAALTGVPVIQEAARQIIEAGEYHPQKDPVAYRREQLRIQLEAEAQFDNSDGLVFTDRGIHTGRGFCYAYGSSVPDFLRKLPEPKPRYGLVFLLEPIPEEVAQRLGLEYHDGVRPAEEDPNSPELRRLPACLRQAYAEEGETVINVPYAPPLERVRFILEAVSRYLDGAPQSRRSASLGRLLDRQRHKVLQTA